MNKNDALIGCWEEKEPRSAQISCKNINGFVSHLQGKVLTVIDASISNGEQREAIKSLIKSGLWDAGNNVFQWIHNQEEKPDGKGNLSTFPF